MATIVNTFADKRGEAFGAGLQKGIDDFLLDRKGKRETEEFNDKLFAIGEDVKAGNLTPEEAILRTGTIASNPDQQQLAQQFSAIISQQSIASQNLEARREESEAARTSREGIAARDIESREDIAGAQITGRSELAILREGIRGGQVTSVNLFNEAGDKTELEIPNNVREGGTEAINAFIAENAEEGFGRVDIKEDTGQQILVDIFTELSSGDPVRIKAVSPQKAELALQLFRDVGLIDPNLMRQLGREFNIGEGENITGQSLINRALTSAGEGESTFDVEAVTLQALPEANDIANMTLTQRTTLSNKLIELRKTAPAEKQELIDQIVDALIAEQ